MKNKYLNIMAALMAAMMIFTLESCANEFVSTSSDNSGKLLIIDSEDETPYDVYLLNAENGAIYSMNLDENFNISDIDVLYSEGNGLINVTFFEDGLVKSINTKDFSFVFSNYNTNMVDIAIICGDEFIMEKAFQSNVNWDSLRIISEDSNSSTRGVGLGSGFDDFADWVANGSFNQNLYDRNSTIHAGLNQVKNIIDFCMEGKKEDNEKETLISMSEWLIDTANDGIFDMALDKDVIADVISTVETAYDVIRKKFTVWDAFIDVIDNYDRWVDFTADIWERFFEFQEEWSRNEELGLSALNTGSGSLKATLSWNFYADIDLYAKEPNGTTICFFNKRSYATGGYLDVDNTIGGIGAAENVYWETPENGTYEFALDYFGPSFINGMSQSGMCKVTIMYKGIGKVYDIPMSADDKKSVTEITLPSGAFTRAIVDNEPSIKFAIRRKDKSISE